MLFDCVSLTVVSSRPNTADANVDVFGPSECKLIIDHAISTYELYFLALVFVVGLLIHVPSGIVSFSISDYFNMCLATIKKMRLWKILWN